MKLKYFKPSEFDSPDEPGSWVNMDPTFLGLMDRLRELSGIPIKINSGFRTLAHNKKVGGKDSSSHTKGFAADINAITSSQKYLIIKTALAIGIKRIGIGSNFVHLDIDPGLPQNVIWTY